LATTGSGDSKPAIEVITGSGGPQPDDYPKPANEVITGFLPEMTLPAQDGQRMASSSEAYRELIELELTRGRNAMGTRHVLGLSLAGRLNTPHLATSLCSNSHSGPLPRQAFANTRN